MFSQGALGTSSDVLLNDLWVCIVTKVVSNSFAEGSNASVAPGAITAGAARHQVGRFVVGLAFAFTDGCQVIEAKLGASLNGCATVGTS
jgi:hypothetical protein